MIIHDCEQGTADWYAVKLGIPSASNFDKIVTPKGQYSKQARRYAFQLLAERVLKTPTESLEGQMWMERGKELEPQAAEFYSFLNDGVELKRVGFVTTDDGKIGCSPDRLVGETGLVEFKCTAPHTHLQYWIDGFGDDYINQVQGQIMVCEREWCDRVSHHPLMPPLTVRTYRDEERISLLRAALSQFDEELDRMEELVRARGLFAERDRPITPVDTAYEDPMLYMAGG